MNILISESVMLLYGWHSSDKRRQTVGRITTRGWGSRPMQGLRISGCRRTAGNFVRAGRMFIQ